ncbi:hypothetical protein E2562_024018 [Oryza meyeriana var. granulata]|uniref:Uncharacterized protein n=1 Tax=Oryza meyeriana var. granulata TaxID=110450 RepID=A0A6G1EBE4_9ORYZ|nr:hypothetical protein E2562_024018 [Oryza meyeriana var. granulata]
MATEQRELDLSYGLRYQVQEITWDGRDSRQRGRTSRKSVTGGNGGGDSRRRWRLERQVAETWTGGASADARDSRRRRLGLQAARTEDWRRRRAWAGVWAARVGK